MFKRFLTGAVITGLIALLGTSLGCDQSSPSPTQPTVPAQPAVIVPSGPPPSVTAISPDTGSTGGTDVTTITGIGFRSPAIVTLGGILTSNYVFTSTTIITSAPAHAAGRVDVIVTNPDGQAGRLTDGFTYASPGSFAVNGNWEGGADSNYGTPLRFTIENSTLTSLSCGTSDLTFSPPPSVSNGAFTYLGPGGASMSGRIESPNSAFGSINMVPCLAYPWHATRQ